MAECDVKGKGKDLTITQGEYLDVISKHNCPKSKVLVQNASGKCEKAEYIPYHGYHLLILSFLIRDYFLFSSSLYLLRHQMESAALL